MIKNIFNHILEEEEDSIDQKKTVKNKKTVDKKMNKKIKIKRENEDGAFVNLFLSRNI